VVRDLCEDLAASQVKLVFARVNEYLRADMDRHQITAVIGEAQIFSTLHEALALVLGKPLEAVATL
jgi:SulP family sulfate permease